MANVYQSLMLERVAAGLIPGASIVTLRGRQPALTTSALTLWQNAASIYPFVTTATLLEVLSSSASDASAGTGAQTVTISGVDANYKAISETIALNGVSAVSSTLTYWRVNSFQVTTVGTGLVQAGTLTLRVTSAGATQSTISTTYPGNAFDYIYTIPAGYLGLVYNLDVGQTTGTGDTTIMLKKFSPTQGSITDFITQFNSTAAGPRSLNTEFIAPMLVPEKTTITAQALVSAGVGDVIATSRMLLINRTGSSGLYSGSNCLGF
jgi:hypothetical protein